MLDKLTNYHPQLPALLILVLAFLLLGLGFSISSSIFPPQPTPVSQVLTVTPLLPPSDTPSPSPTSTSTPRPTWTLAPTLTPTQTGTPTATATVTPLPTLTPARPLQFNDLYRLREWTPERADNLVKLLQGYPNARFPREADRLNPAYDAAFEYAAFAQREALLRMPDEPQAESWRWGLAYSLSRLNDPSAGASYLALIEEALNASQASLETLPDWFAEHEKRLELNTRPFTAPDGAIQSRIIEIRTMGGGVYLWILESVQGFRGQVLVSRFDFPNQIYPSHTSGDLTGDGVDELVVIFSPALDNNLLQTPFVFDLSARQARELPFAPEMPFDFATEFQNEWIAAETSEGIKYLQFIGSIYPACPVRVMRAYHWDGSRFVSEETRYTIQPHAGLEGHCERVVTHISNTWEPEATTRLMRVLLPDWPPASQADGRPYPPEAHDEWRLKAGLHSALAGQRDEAIQTMQEIVSLPAVPGNTWAVQAGRFLEIYQSEEDLYKACQEIESCALGLALERLARTIPMPDYHNAPAYLDRFGIDRRASGIFDFENDGMPERWIIVQHRPGQELEFWILAQGPESARAIFVEVADTGEPFLRYHEPAADPPVVQTRMRAGFILLRVPDTQEPYLVHVPVEFFPTTYTLDALNTATTALFAGADPASVRRDLEAVRESDRFNCLNYRICARFRYTLALAYELSGDQKIAIDEYIDLWWNERASQYTTMARLKLEQLPYNSPTPTRTLTPDPNATPTQTLTPTVTDTPDPNATPTNTPTITPTPTDTPSPTVSPTVQGL
jgi:hypothetical protein